jgi:subtilisin family serine protease
LKGFAARGEAAIAPEEAPVMVRMPVRPALSAALTLALVATVSDAAPGRRVPGEMVMLLPRENAATVRNKLAPDAATAAVRRLDAELAARGLARARWLSADGRAVLVRSADPAFDATADARARELVAAGVARAAAPNILLDLELTTPNDPYLATQWHLGTTAAGIRAQNAWDLEVGDPSVVIGILDTGVDLGHPDLASRIWVNADEIPANAIDDDGNGYVDDVNGYDFAHDDADPNPAFVVDSTAGLDVGWHGTFGAGLAAAAGNNAVGITGVAWDCRIMALKVSSDSTAGITLASATEAWNYALDNGCSVLNLSLAGTDPILEGFFQPLVNDAIDAGVVCVAAAGNSGLDDAHWPAACDSTLSVAATTQANQRASFSSWGWYVNIAAPGENVWSSIARNYARDEAHDFFFQFFFAWDGVNPYMYNSGTSFATPIVSGAVALVRSRFPGVPPRNIIDHMIATADVVPTYNAPIGGRLNAYQALLTNVDVTPRAGGGPGVSLGPVVPNPLRTVPGAGATVSFHLPSAGDVTLAVYDARGRRLATLAGGRYDAGSHRASWNGRDDFGRRAPAGLYFVAGTLGGVARSARVVVLP